MFEETGVNGLMYLDPIGAILISVYIIVNWAMTGYSKYLTLKLERDSKLVINEAMDWLII